MPVKKVNIKVINEIASLVFNNESKKWEVILTTTKGKHVLIRSSKSELAIKYFQGSTYRARLEGWGVNALEVMINGKFEKTVPINAVKVRVKPTTAKVNRKKAVRKPFSAFEVTAYGSESLAGESKVGRVVSKSGGNYNIQFTSIYGTTVRPFNTKTGRMKGDNPFHGWKVNVNEVEKLHKESKLI